MDGENMLMDEIVFFLRENLSDPVVAGVIRESRRPRSLLGRLLALIAGMTY